MVRLVERREREVRLSPEDVQFLLAHARHLVEIVPAFQLGAYRITPKGIIGWFDGPKSRFAIRPRAPWPTARMLLGLTRSVREGNPNPDSDAELLDALARELSERLRAVVAAGLVAGYVDRDSASAFLRGSSGRSINSAKQPPAHFPTGSKSPNRYSTWARPGIGFPVPSPRNCSLART